MDPFLNQVLCQRYKIRARLSQKPGRRTFVATDLQTDTTVIVKLLLFDVEFTWETLRLFERESAALQSLDHPAIPQYLDFVDIETDLGKGFLLVQTYIEAKSLQDWIMTGRTFSEEDLHYIAQEALNILDYLHDRKPVVIHRDIKPSNLLLTERTGNNPGQLYLVDFGGIQAPQQGSTITIVGTYGYMPLEQFGGRAVPASDLYSLGATLIYLATGLHPANLPQKDMRLQFADQVRLSPEFVHWLEWLTEPDIAKRPQTAAIARERFNQSPTQPADGLHPLRVPPPQNSAIQLSQTQEHFKIQVPSKKFKLEFLLLAVISSRLTQTFGAFGNILAGVLLILLVVTGLIWPAFIILLLIYFHMNKRGKRHAIYSITFEKSIQGTLISLTEIHRNRERVLFKQSLTQMTAGPDKIPQYKIKLKSEGPFHTIRINGSYQEIRWLCDELDSWAPIPITYESYNEEV
ncbi:serine/threonine protein kinase [Leptolyngbya sp. PCC 7375]|nr:serine/threonine protein kinase [Leptolyngbya sp. PCC 7375]